MAAKPRYHNPVPLNELVSRIVDPVLAKRAGITTSLLQSWDEIVGARLARHSRPEQIKWNRQASNDDAFEPATLVIACEAMAALHIQHETSEIIARINAFLGYAAIGRVKIVQKTISPQPPPVSAKRTLSAKEEQAIADKLVDVSDDGLRDALERLGKNVAASRK